MLVNLNYDELFNVRLVIKKNVIKAISACFNILILFLNIKSKYFTRHSGVGKTVPLVYHC